MVFQNQNTAEIDKFKLVDNVSSTGLLTLGLSNTPVTTSAINSLRELPMNLMRRWESGVELYEHGLNVLPIQYPTTVAYGDWHYFKWSRLPRNKIKELCTYSNIAVVTGRTSNDLFV